MGNVVKMKCSSRLETLDIIADKMKEEFWTESVCDERNDKAILLCFEEYYFRVSSYVALTLMFTEDDNGQYVVIAGMGGGSGLSNISWGANKSFEKRAVKFLQQYGFEIYE